MHTRVSLPRAAVDLARMNGGLISTAQLADAGVGPDDVRSLAGRELTRLSNGLFVTGGGPTWDQYLRAALHIAQPAAEDGSKEADGGTSATDAGPRVAPGGSAGGGSLRARAGSAVAYGGTALRLFGLADEQLPVEILVSGGAQPRGRKWARFVRATTPRRLLTDLDPPRTALEDAVLDYCNSVDAGDACALVTRALQERRTTPGRLAASLASRVRQRHRPLITDLIDDAAGVESVLEYRYITDVERPHKLPPFRRPYVVPETGHRSDGAYVDRRLLIELDGLRWHDKDADRNLDLEHDLLRYTTLRIEWIHVIRAPCATAAYVGRALGLTPTCLRCR